MSHDLPEDDLESSMNSSNKLDEAGLASLSHDDLVQKVLESQQMAAERWERIVRMQAETANADRRASRDVSNAHKYALEKFANELLPIIDSLELCISTVPEGLEGPAFSVVEGVKLTLKMFYAAMEKFGMKQVSPLYEPFDPEYQQAISTQYDPKVEPGLVMSVLQKGYTLNGRVLRPALVTVSKAKE